MKRGIVILAPPLVFVMSAVMAWLTGSPAGKSLAGVDAMPGPWQREAAALDSRDLSAALLRMENRILPHNPAPPRKTFDAHGMDDVIFSDDEGPLYCGIGMAAIQYAGGWAEEAPEEMFAWLVHQSDKKWIYASILFERWAKKDVNAALDAATRIPNSKLRAQAMISSLEVLCASDPVRARDLLTQNLSLFSAGVCGSLAHLSAAGKAGIDMIDSLPVGEERARLLAGLLDYMNGSSDAVEFWKGLPDAGRRELVAAGFAPSMTEAESYDGLANLMRERAETSGDPAVAENFIQGQGAAWAKRDLAGALDWMRVHVKGKSRAEWREKFFQAGIQQDFDRTTRVWRELPEGYVKTDVADAILRAAPVSRKAEAETLLKLSPP